MLLYQLWLQYAVLLWGRIVNNGRQEEEGSWRTTTADESNEAG